jgi:hypothetical protein
MSTARSSVLNALRVGDYVYGTSGSPALFMASTSRPERSRRQRLRAGDALYADGKAIVLDEDGDLAMLRHTPDGMTVLAQANVFKTRSWTVPTLVGATLYARDREQIAAFDLAAR